MKSSAIPEGQLELVRLPRPPELIWRVPGSKSITNRALLLAALAEGDTELEGVLASDDTAHMRKALEALGIAVRERGPTALTVSGGRSRLRAPDGPLFIGNSGTAVRFLAALAALVPGDVTLAGDDAMARRPIGDLVDGLRQLGVAVDCPTGSPPLTVRGGRLAGGSASMRGERSSQYFSALMLVGALAESDIRIRVEGQLVSRPYVEITRRMVADFGGQVDEEGDGFVVRARGEYRARSYQVEPDASAASYPFALAAATRGSIGVPDLGPGTLQGDYAFIDVLERVGAYVTRSSELTTVRGEGLRGVDVDMHDISDTVMTLAAIAPLVVGRTRITNIANIRIKETDRLAAVATELERLGQGVNQGADFIEIEPRPLRPALVRTYGDHRMAMSFAVLGMAAGGITIEDPACVSKTYPGFWQDVAACYRSSGATVAF